MSENILSVVFGLTFNILMDMHCIYSILGRWSGYLGDVVDGITEFSIMGTTVTSQRSTAVDFAGPIE